MMRRSLACLAMSAVFSLSPVEAQQLGNCGPSPGGFGATRCLPTERVSLHVQVNYQLQIPSDRTASLDDQKRTIDMAHAALYDLAKHECETLSKSFDGECRMVNLTVNNMVMNYGPSITVPFNGSATFEMVAPAIQPSAPPKP